MARALWMFGLMVVGEACGAANAPSFDEVDSGERVELVGRVITLVEDDAFAGHARSRIAHVLETADGARIPLAFEGREVPRATHTLLVEGVRRGRVLDVVRTRDLDALGESRQALVAEGAHKTAILLFNFQKNPSTPFSGADVNGMLFGASSIDAYFREQSFDRLSFVGRDGPEAEVYGWVTIDADPGVCDPQLWQQQARAAVSASTGVDWNDYDHILMYFPTASSCPWAGLAEAPGKLVWIQGDALRSSAVAHELGHNLGLHHADVLRCEDASGTRTANTGTCKRQDYGDYFDVMSADGRLPPHHTNAKNKAFLGWFSPDQVANVTESVELALHPLESVTPGIHAISIPLADGSALWLDFRQRIGTDSYDLDDPILNGISLRLSGDVESFVGTSLIDTVPETETIDDATLTVGRTFVDEANALRITMAALSSGVATVRIQIGDAPIPEPPTPEPDADAGTSEPAPSDDDEPSEEDAGVPAIDLDEDRPSGAPRDRDSTLEPFDTRRDDATATTEGEPIRGVVGCSVSAWSRDSRAWLLALPMLTFVLRMRRRAQTSRAREAV